MEDDITSNELNHSEFLFFFFFQDDNVSRLLVKGHRSHCVLLSQWSRAPRRWHTWLAGRSSLRLPEQHSLSKGTSWQEAPQKLTQLVYPLSFLTLLPFLYW